MSEAGGKWMEPNVYGFARHLSCNHPSRAIPYFAVDIAGYRYIFTCELSERVCVHARLSVRLLVCFIVLSSVVSRVCEETPRVGRLRRRNIIATGAYP